jgi:demethylmenaquinone methyltransferase / 2-methoxy-6-polyprenyl-1,4-benzoquinol methylase
MGFNNSENSNRSIQELFSRIADKYDRMNQTISFGRAMSWRLDAIQELHICHSDRIVDIATGSGDLALLIKEKFKDTFVIGIDITPEMIGIARMKDAQKKVNWVIADALALPFGKESFEKVISAYLLRNVPDIQACLAEQYRITRKDSWIVTLETTPPPKSLFSPVIYFYLLVIMPMLGFLLAQDFGAYQYLSKSTIRFYQSDKLSSFFAQAKFTNIRYIKKSLGLITIISAEKSKNPVSS